MDIRAMNMSTTCASRHSLLLADRSLSRFLLTCSDRPCATASSTQLAEQRLSAPIRVFLRPKRSCGRREAGRAVHVSRVTTRKNPGIKLPGISAAAVMNDRRYLPEESEDCTVASSSRKRTHVAVSLASVSAPKKRGVRKAMP